MNEAIKLAIEKGEWNGNRLPQWFDDFGVAEIDKAWISSDPLFWQALGKALGWNGTICRLCGENPIFEEENFIQCNQHGENTIFVDGWIYYAHRYFDLILTGGDTEKFWKELLTSKE